MRHVTAQVQVAKPQRSSSTSAAYLLSAGSAAAEHAPLQHQCDRAILGLPLAQRTPHIGPFLLVSTIHHLHTHTNSCFEAQSQTVMEVAKQTSLGDGLVPQLAHDTDIQQLTSSETCQ